MSGIEGLFYMAVRPCKREILRTSFAPLNRTSFKKIGTITHFLKKESLDVP